MTRLTSEPSTPVRSMDDLMAIAFAMEKETAERYAALAVRMRTAGREELAAIFDRLVEEETSHMDMVVAWSQQTLRHAPAVVEHEPIAVFDDEGAALIAPELQDAYHSFAMAVRNEERAFAFWSYVAADAPTTEIREAAERMAREELEHAKILRRERRKAFFQRRLDVAAEQEPYDLAALELEVARALEERSGASRIPGEYRDLAGEARLRSRSLVENPIPAIVPTGLVPRSLDALCEWLADYYIEAGESLDSQAERDRAQVLATAAVRRLALMRHLEAM